MKQWIKVFMVIPVMLLLSQCIFVPWGTGFVDGTVFDAVDGYSLSGVYVEVFRHAGCGGCPHPGGAGGTLVASAVTDCDGYFACEFPLRSGYHYVLVLSRIRYYTESLPLGIEPDLYIEIDLEPVW